MSSDSGKRKIPWGVSPSNLDCIIQVRVVGKVLFRVLILGVIFLFCFTPPHHHLPLLGLSSGDWLLPSLQITQEFSSRLESIRSHFPNGPNGPTISTTDGGNGAETGSAENAGPLFELNIALQDLQK